MPRCSHTYADSSKCKRIVGAGQSHCYSHDPARAQERKHNAAKGGRRAGRGRPSPVSSELARLQGMFEDLAQRVLSGEVERGDGAVAAQLLNGSRACVIGLLKAREQEQLEERLEQLEEVLQKRGDRYGA